MKHTRPHSRGRFWVHLLDNLSSMGIYFLIILSIESPVERKKNYLYSLNVLVDCRLEEQIGGMSVVARKFRSLANLKVKNRSFPGAESLNLPGGISYPDYHFYL